MRIGSARPVDCELPLAVSLALGMPANERMDWRVEKATELGVAEIQPLVCERSVLRLQPVRPLTSCLDEAASQRSPVTARFLLSLAEGAQPVAEAICPAVRAGSALLFLSGPEGGTEPGRGGRRRAAGLP